MVLELLKICLFSVRARRDLYRCGTMTRSIVEVIAEEEAGTDHGCLSEVLAAMHVVLVTSSFLSSIKVSAYKKRCFGAQLAKLPYPISTSLCRVCGGLTVNGGRGIFSATDLAMGCYYYLMRNAEGSVSVGDGLL